MASITLQPGALPIEALQGGPAQQAAPGAPTANANQAQSAPAPQDTVVLAGRVTETALNGENQNGSQFQGAAAFYTAQGILSAQSNVGATAPSAPATAPAQTGAPETPQTMAQVAAATNPATSADPAIAAAVAANSQPSVNDAGAADPSDSAGTPVQQLAQLDQTLQQLGIDPQSLSLADRMGMLLYANDPAALRVMVQEIQGGGQSVAQPAVTGPAANAAAPQTQTSAQVQAQELLQTSGQAPPANPAQAQIQTQSLAAAQVQDQNANPAGGAPFQLAAAQYAQNQFQAAAPQENGGANLSAQENQSTSSSAADNAGANQNAQTNALTVQFERLQITFSEAEAQNSQAASQAASADANSEGQLLDVTA
jgi:hypothetical protein